MFSSLAQRLRAELIKNTAAVKHGLLWEAAEIQSLVGVIRDGVKEAAEARRGLKCGG